MRFRDRQPLHHRDFFDRGGTLWFVSEWEASHVPDAPGECFLVFDSLVLCRRLWCYPRDWYELSEFELAVLNEGDEPAPASGAARNGGTRQGESC